MDKFARLKAFGYLLLVLFTIPLIAWRMDASSATNDAPGDEKGRPALFQACERMDRDSSEYWQDVCSPGSRVSGVRLVSGGVAVCGIALLAFIYGSRAFVGSDRRRLTLIFGPVVRTLMLVLSACIVAQAGLLLFIFFGVSASTRAGGRGGLVLLAIAFGAVVAAYQLVRYAVSAMEAPTLNLRGFALDPDVHPRLYATVRDIAAKLEAQPPDQIVAGLDPNFFVTTSEVKPAGGGANVSSDDEVLRGRTLYVSLGLMRILSKAEFAAVVGHELGHFRGQDVEYSMKFAPTYARLTQGLQALTEGQNGYAALGRLPAYVALLTVLAEFSSAERAIGRQRELAADQAGASAADANSLAMALVKVSLFDSVWPQVLQADLQDRSRGQAQRNLSALCAQDYEQACHAVDWDKVRQALASNVQPHPVDTHPPLGQRLLALGVGLANISREQLHGAADASIALVEGATGLEESLTTVVENFILAMLALKGLAPPMREARVNG